MSRIPSSCYSTVFLNSLRSPSPVCASCLLTRAWPSHYQDPSPCQNAHGPIITSAVRSPCGSCPSWQNGSSERECARTMRYSLGLPHLLVLDNLVCFPLLTDLGHRDSMTLKLRTFSAGVRAQTIASPKPRSQWLTSGFSFPALVAYLKCRAVERTEVIR